MKTVSFHLHHKSEIFRSAQRAQFFICFTLAKFVDPKSWKTQQILIKIKYSAVCVQCNFYTAIALGACDKYILLQKSGLGLRVKCAHPIWRNVKPCFWFAPANGIISCVFNVWTFSLSNICDVRKSSVEIFLLRKVMCVHPIRDALEECEAKLLQMWTCVLMCLQMTLRFHWVKYCK